MTYQCAVCGYSKLIMPPKDHMICPCCGTQFGYHDSIARPEELRKEWVAAGVHWHSRRILPPANWNPIEQLRCAGFAQDLYFITARTTVSEIGHLNLYPPRYIKPGIFNVAVAAG